jgi:predicted DNA-binding protein
MNKRKERKMARKKLPGTEEPQDSKLSLLLPRDLHQRLREAAKLRKLNKSIIVRDLLRKEFEEEQPQERGSPGVSQAASPQGGEQGLTITLPDELWACVEMASKLHGLEPATLVQLMLNEHIETLIEKGKQKREELRRLSEGEQQLECQPEGE